MTPRPGHYDVEASPEDRKGTRQQPPGIKGRISHFTWSNFACTMSTGAIAVVLSQQPFTFDGLNVIGKIFFILDLVLLLAFMATMVTRFVLQPWKFTKSLHYPKEALFFGSFWVSIALVLTCTQQYGVPSCGPWLVKALEVCFWLYAACALLVAIFQYCTLFVAEQMPVSSAMPAWVFPVYPFLVIGPLAAVLIPSQPQSSALPIFVGGVLLQGLGWTVAMFMYSIYVIRLMSNELPPPSTRPGMFISVGPAGYTSAGLVALGNQAPNVIPQDFLSLPNFDVGAAIKVLGVMSGIFVWLVAFWFFALSLVAVLTGVRKMSFTLNWWAFIFPNAGMILAAIQIGMVLNSTGIKAVTSGMTILLVVAWLFTAGSHIVAVVRKQIWWQGRDEDDGMEDQISSGLKSLVHDSH
ncbi:hypothetical protein PMZ80_000155 [Knufia obscura]|uniref:Malic acid transport protein n=1 Tax=Knufia obscura TaxID=1635080 RepID=A0ABR0RZK8_9EURO|nr:hypothetical protein PMZ80_000155 [Knufia obscura]